MKKTCRFLTLTAVMAVTASLAVPAFAASEKGDKEGTASFFSTFVGENHIYTNPATEVFAPTPSATDATATTPAPETTAPAAVDNTTAPYALGWNWMSFPEPSDDDN
ncbi:hypothetical protein ACFSO0_09905 [Brevibacillus sp. GCM10020057]|uniref:hypothetical protein n=1 Tax=Brevibacillus sp. GCM10020057 TaxID=3317327 RepID=UPI003645A8B9